MRRATNKVQAVFAHSLVFTFDDGRNGTDLEGVAGPNDSGGPAFLEKDGVRYLAGVASFASNNAEPGTYGTLDAYTRVSSHRDWIAGVIAQDPPSTVPKWSDEHRITAAGDWPATALGSLAGNFLKAYAAGPKPFAGYVGEYGPRSDGSEEASSREWAARAAEWGDLVPYSYRTLGERDIAFIAYATRSNEWRGFWLTADSADAARFTSVATGGVSRPDGAPPRLPAPN